jgi:23S rRNA (guanosine2251-2'-O)-methyltransferase
MRATAFEIRVCQSCGLRYPLLRDQSVGKRCPLCLGETKPVLQQSLADTFERDVGTFNEGGRLEVMLDNIRSASNVGSILRSADGFAFQHAYLCGITPTPENREVRKTALGADNFVT